MKGEYYFSPSQVAFYPASLREVYEYAGCWPVDGEWVSAELHEQLMNEQAAGRAISSDVKGNPVAIERPPLSRQQRSAHERRWRDSQLLATDGLVVRHRDQLETGKETTLLPVQYHELMSYRASLRDWPEEPLFPDSGGRPSVPDWLRRYVTPRTPPRAGFFINGDLPMSFFHGVTVTNVDIGARTIALPASSVIGLCDVFTPGAQASAKPNVPVLLTSKKDAAAAFGIGSSIYLACEAIYNRAQAVIVAVGVEAAETPEAQASAVIGGVSAAGERTGLQALLDGKSRFNAQPRLLVAPGHSAQQAVATAMDGLAEKLRAIAILDGPNSTDEAAVAYAKNFGSKRLFMVDPGVQVWDSATNAARKAPASAYAAGLFAWTDAEYGFWSSPSNKEIKGITGTSRPVEFLDGDETCRANLLNNANIATIIRDDGYRLWGNRTLSSDSKWAFVTRVRTMDLVMDAILAGHKWAVDRGITKTYVKDVTEGLRAFMRDLKNQGAVINFEVYADPDLNSASQLAQGKVYWNIRFTDVPPAENPNFRVEVTDQWLTEVLDVA